MPGSYPYLFQQRIKLIAQLEQEGLQETIFGTISAADNHWKHLTTLLHMTNDATPTINREALHDNSQIVYFYFC